MSNTPFLPDANRSHSLELIALENLGKSFRNVYILIAITFAIIIFFYATNFICSFYTQKALTETSTAFFLICWFGGMIYVASATIVLILFLINIWNTPVLVEHGRELGKAFIGLLFACIGLCFCSDVIPIEFIELFNYVIVFFFIIETFIFLGYLNYLAKTVGSSRFNYCMNWFLCGAFCGLPLPLKSSVIRDQAFVEIDHVVSIIFGLACLFCFFFSFYYMTSDISAFIDNQRLQNDNCQPENQQ